MTASREPLFETDWLGSQPVFYNTKTGQTGRNIHDVIEYANAEFDPEGLNNYLDFGYSVFEQTPVKHVRFLRHSSRLWLEDNGSLRVEYLPDPVESWLDRRYTEDDIFDLLRERVQTWERRQAGAIVIPTSGGYDSRLLNLLVEDRSRIRAFTYGISRRQFDSFEVVHARELARRLGLAWQQVELGECHRYFDDWDALYGVATHAHGMYQMEFYHKIREQGCAGAALLSGIIGDAWAGSVQLPPVSGLSDVVGLAYTHGMHADSFMSRLRAGRPLLSAYYDDHKARLADYRWRVVEAMRLKLLLLSYLCIVPESLGFHAWSPFLDIDLAMAMLNLPPERRRNRLWQRDFFRKHGVDLEAQGLRASRRNDLNRVAMRRVLVPALEVGLLRDVVRQDYLEWINRQVRRQGAAWDAAYRAAQWLRSVGAAPARFGDLRLPAYCAYLTLKPIDSLLRRRSNARRTEPVTAQE